VSSLIPVPQKIGFIHNGAVGFGPDTARCQPIGGTQAATGYLAAALAARGHEVWLLSHCAAPNIQQGVVCHPLAHLPLEVMVNLDALIMVQSLNPDLLWSLMPLLSSNTLCVLWTGQAHDQPALAALANSTNHGLLDQIWCVSNWQKQGFCTHFGVNPDQISVLRNAVAPVFEQLAHQSRHASMIPKRAYYASMPFRGLSLLLNAWAAWPDNGCHLDIMGGMAQYHQPDTPYDALYHQALQLPTIMVHGALGHDDLAPLLAAQDIWLYPSIFAETSCITALEALAVGALPIVSDLGALPETLGGFGIIFPYNTNNDRMVRDLLFHFKQQSQEWPNHDHSARIAAQKKWILENATWDQRARMVEEALMSDGRVPV